MSEPFDTVIAAYSAGYERGQQDELARIQEWLRSERSILWLLGNNGRLGETGKDLAEALQRGEHARGCEGCGVGPDDECESGCPAHGKV